MRMGMLARGFRVLATLCLWLPFAGRVATAQPTTPDTLPAAAPAPVPLVVFGDTVAWFSADVAGISPQRRATIAHDRIEALKRDHMLAAVHAEPLDRGYMVLVGDVLAFMFMPGDAAPGPSVAGTADADRVAERLGATLHKRAKAIAPGQRLVGLGWSLLATLILVLLLRILGWAHKKALGWINAHTTGHRTSARFGELDFLGHFTWLLSWLARALVQLAGVVFVVLWAVYVLNRFPETQGIGAMARSTIAAVLRGLQAHFVSAIPGVIAVAIIVVLARFAQRLAGDVFTGIERGTIRFPGIHPETARATRRLVTAGIWLFAVVVAYPLLPGSNSDAFKGVSVFLGLMVTLGSSGVMGHMMSGLVIVYSRAMQAGDIVRVNDIEGIVSEVGALSVKLINTRKEEFTIPNSVIVGTTVKNFSRQDRETGPVLTVALTIGYDAPWRVVYDMLKAAAERTPGVRKQPAPAVFQASLSDFYVEYHLVVRVDDPMQRFVIMSRLHENIQDAFNEQGVQIMSPHFEKQPDAPVFVPKERWFSKPSDGAAATTERAKA